MAEANDKPTYREKLKTLIFTSLLIILLIFEIAALIIWIPGAWSAKLSVVLAIIGIYGLVVAFLSKISVFKDNPEIFLDRYTAPNIRTYIASNFVLFTYIFGLLGGALRGYLKSGVPFYAQYIGGLIIFLFSPVILIYFLFQMLIVLPFAYIPVLIVSALVVSLEGSDDVEFIHTDNQGKKVTFVASRIIKDDPIFAKGFLIGIPAIVLSFYSSIVKLFIT